MTDMQKVWLSNWKRFDGLYQPHAEEMQGLIQQHAKKFELAYEELEVPEDREPFIGQCYTLAKRHGLPLSLVDWWRELQVCWVDGEDNTAKYPDMLPVQGNRYVKYQRDTLRSFRTALSGNDDVEVMFLAAMLEAIRAAEAQRLLWKKTG